MFSHTNLEHFRSLFSLEAVYVENEGLVPGLFSRVRDVIVNLGDTSCFMHSDYMKVLWTFVATVLLHNATHSGPSTAMITSTAPFGLFPVDDDEHDATSLTEVLRGMKGNGAGKHLVFNTHTVARVGGNVPPPVCKLLPMVLGLSLECLTVPFLWFLVFRDGPIPDVVVRTLRVSYFMESLFTLPDMKQFAESAMVATFHGLLLLAACEKMILEIRSPLFGLPLDVIDLKIPRDGPERHREVMIDVLLDNILIYSLIPIICNMPQRHVIVRFLPVGRNPSATYFSDIIDTVQSILNNVSIYDTEKRVTILVRLHPRAQLPEGNNFLVYFVGSIFRRYTGTHDVLLRFSQTIIVESGRCSP